MNKLITNLLLVFFAELLVELCGILMVFILKILLLNPKRELRLVGLKKHRRFINQLLLQRLLQFIELFVQTRVPLVFYLVIGTPLEILGNLGPLVTVDLMSQ